MCCIRLPMNHELLKRCLETLLNLNLVIQHQIQFTTNHRALVSKCLLLRGFKYNYILFSIVPEYYLPEMFA